MSESDPCTPGTLGGQLRVSLQRIARKLRAQRGEADLTDGQFAVLASIKRHGPMTPGALAEHENIRPPSMTRTVNTLVELGLVAKASDESDKRLVVVELTDAGQNEINVTRRRRDAWLTEKLGQLTPEERQTLADASELLTRIASQ